MNEHVNYDDSVIPLSDKSDLDIDALRKQFPESYNLHYECETVPFKNSDYFGRKWENCPTHYLSWIIHQPWIKSNILRPVGRVLKARVEAEKVKVKNYTDNFAVGE